MLILSWHPLSIAPPQCAERPIKLRNPKQPLHQRHGPVNRSSRSKLHNFSYKPISRTTIDVQLGVSHWNVARTLSQAGRFSGRFSEYPRQRRTAHRWLLGHYDRAQGLLTLRKAPCQGRHGIPGSLWPSPQRVVQWTCLTCGVILRSRLARGHAVEFQPLPLVVAPTGRMSLMEN